MSALLRLQAVALRRAIAQPATLVRVVGLMVLVLVMGATGDGPGATLAFMSVITVVLIGMTRTIETLDAVRWAAPIRRGHAVRAYFGFWAMVCSPLIVTSAILLSRDALGAAILLLHLALVVVGAASIVMFYQRITRRGFGVAAMVAGIAVGSVLVWPTAWSFYLAWSGRAEALLVIAVVAGVSWALGVPSFLREELVPASAGTTVERTASRAQREATAVARSPVAILLRAAYPPLWTTFWILFGVVFPILVPSISVVAVWTPIAASNLAGIALQSWRWLAATPIDRGRVFRVLFGAPLAFVVLVMAARIAIVETTTNRSAFFRDHRRAGFESAGASTLTLSQLLKSGPTGNGYRAAEASDVAAGVRRHLEDNCGLFVPAQRIEADLRRGWPEHPTPGDWDGDMGYVLDGLERVRADLGGEISAAGRRRDVLVAVGVVLAFLALLRAQFQGRLLGVVFVVIVGLPLATLALGRRDFPRFAAATDDLYRAVFGMPTAALWALAAGACVAGAFLWWNSVRAFRRIDVLDIPPNPTTPRRR